jgi:nucleotide-binding universal stress UspA family protein
MPGIVVGVDGSGHSRKALETAAKEATAHQVGLTVLTVHQAVRGLYGTPANWLDDATLTDQAKEAAQAETDEVLASLGAKPESVTVTAVHGLPAEELVKASEGADMLVLGRRGTSGFHRLLMGAVTSQVAYLAHCPVLIVPPADEA